MSKLENSVPEGRVVEDPGEGPGLAVEVLGGVGLVGQLGARHLGDVGRGVAGN